MRTNIGRTIATAVVALAVLAPAASARSLTLNQGRTAIRHWAKQVATDAERIAREEGTESAESAITETAPTYTTRLGYCDRFDHGRGVGCIVDLIDSNTHVDCGIPVTVIARGSFLAFKSGKAQCAQGEG